MVDERDERDELAKRIVHEVLDVLAGGLPFHNVRQFKDLIDDRPGEFASTIQDAEVAVHHLLP